MTDILAEGKTKIVYSWPDDPALALCKSKSDITAGDGAKHDVIGDKNVLATETTCNVFELLNGSGIPTAFVRRLRKDEFVVRRCAMLPYEVVARRLIVPKSSSIQRDPALRPGTRFEALVVEFYLKTSGPQFHDIVFPFGTSDPLVTNIGSDGLTVHDAHAPVTGGGVNIPRELLGWRFSAGKGDNRGPFTEMEQLVRRVFLILEKAWALENHRLCDLKVEFGMTTDDRLVVADVIDNDSWRVLSPEGEHLDKQSYRDGMPLPTVKGKYVAVAERTKRFAMLAPRGSRIVLWRGSEKDDLAPFVDALATYCATSTRVWTGVGSMHKAPERCLRALRAELVRDTAPTVVIVYAGRSNGAGPIVAGAVDCPVITVPAGAKDFPEDVWSSLRMPSDLPLLTALSPQNAILAALSILGQSDPCAYSAARMVRESFWIDQENSPTYGRDV